MSTTAEMLSAWLNGTPTGGPNGDGRYPLVYKDGNTYLVYCPAAQALNPSLTEQPIETFSITASNAAANALTEADAANDSAIHAAASAAAAAASAATASAKAAATLTVNPNNYYLKTESDARYRLQTTSITFDELTGAATDGQLPTTMAGKTYSSMNTYAFNTEAIRMGTATAKGHIAFDGNWWAGANTYYNYGTSAWVQEDATKPSFIFLQHINNNRWEFRNQPAGGSQSTVVTISAAGLINATGAAFTGSTSVQIGTNKKGVEFNADPTNEFSYIDWHSSNTSYIDYDGRISVTGSANPTSGGGAFAFTGASFSFNNSISVNAGNIVASAGAGLFDLGGAAATANTSLRAKAGGYSVNFYGRLSGANYSPLVQTGDSALIFDAGASNSGALVIAQWSGSSRGIRIAADGTFQINGNNAWHAGNFDPSTKASLTSPVFTGNVALTDAAGTARRVLFRTAGVERWQVGADGTAEGGANAGSNFVLKRYDDAGTQLTDVFAANRATGVLDFKVAPTILGSAVVVASQIGVANGITPLGSDNKIATTYLPAAVLGQVAYQGTWDATTAAPSSTPTKGQYWVVTVAGSTNLSGITDWKVGDWAIHNGTTWDKVDNTDAISSWNGRTGAIVPAANDYTFAQLASKPSTLAGYGITDAVADGTAFADWATADATYYNGTTGIINCNSLAEGTRALVAASGSNANYPGTQASYWHIETIRPYVSGTLMQRAWGYNQSVTAYRTYNGTTWSGWAVFTNTTMNFSGEVQSTSTNAFRAVAGSYGAFWRNDGANFYLLFTASGDQYGTYNSLRPLAVSVTTGAVTIGNGLTVTGGLAFTQTVASSVTDLTKQIQLWAGYGFSITSSRLNYNVATGGSHYFVVNGVDVFGLNAAGIIPQVQNFASAATITPAAGDDMVKGTALAVAATIAAPSGTPNEGWGFVIRLKDNGTARALTWNAIYRVASGVALPTTTVVGKTHYIACIYNATDTKVDVLSVTSV